MMKTLCLLIISAALIGGDEKLSKGQEREWRELVSRAVLEQGGEELLRAAEAYAQVSTRELARAARKGPLYDPASAEPREVGGELETLEQFGRTTSGYSFEFEGHVYRYAVNTPRKYTSDRAWPLLLDPGHGSGARGGGSEKAEMLDFYRSLADGAGGQDWLVVRTEIIEQVGTDGVHKELPEDRVVAVFDAFFRDLYSRFHVDLSQVRVAGISQTGFWSWYLAAARPSRFAGLAPAAAVTWQVNPNLENLRNLAIFVAHGDGDPKCKVQEPRAAVRRLASLGARVRYLEVAGAGHDGAVFGRIGEGLEFLADHPRDPYPKEVSKACANLEEGGWSYWLRIDELKREDQGEASPRRVATGGIDGVIRGQAIHLNSEGVQAVTLGLAREMLDLDKTITVTWNGKTVHKGKVETRAVDLLELLGDKADWTGVFEAKLELKAPRR